jgi:hypothetical protein
MMPPMLKEKVNVLTKLTNSTEESIKPPSKRIMPNKKLLFLPVPLVNSMVKLETNKLNYKSLLLEMLISEPPENQILLPLKPDKEPP